MPPSWLAARKVAPVLFGIRADNSVAFALAGGVLLTVGLPARHGAIVPYDPCPVWKLTMGACLDKSGPAMQLRSHS